jgi:hypothetical protein
LVILLIGLLVPAGRVLLLSLGLGMLTHVLRDSATASTAFLWPISDHAFHLRYSLYLAVLIGFTVIASGVVALGPPGHHR